MMIDSGDDHTSSSDDGKERIIILTGTDMPKRIDGGPKSANVSRYHRDYYVPSTFSTNDVFGFDPPKRQDSREHVAGDVVEKTKAKLFAKQHSVDELKTSQKSGGNEVSRIFRSTWSIPGSVARY